MTDWTSIRDRLRENEERYTCMCEFVDKQMDTNKPLRGDATELLREYNKARDGYAQTVLALAEAERMVQDEKRAAHKLAVRILRQSPAGMVNAHPPKGSAEATP